MSDTPHEAVRTNRYEPGRRHVSFDVESARLTVVQEGTLDGQVYDVMVVQGDGDPSFARRTFNGPQALAVPWVAVPAFDLHPAALEGLILAHNALEDFVRARDRQNV